MRGKLAGNDLFGDRHGRNLNFLAAFIHRECFGDFHQVALVILNLLPATDGGLIRHHFFQIADPAAQSTRHINSVTPSPPGNSFHGPNFRPFWQRALMTAKCYGDRPGRYFATGSTILVPGPAGGGVTAGAFVATVSAAASSSGRMVMAIRRLRARPSGVELSATGRNSP